jgi:hypothetical protein
MKNICIKIASVGIVILALLMFDTKSSQAQTKNHKAYSLFLYNFMKHTNWPSDHKEAFKVALVGDSKTYEFLSQGTADKKINGRSIEVQLIKDANDLSEFDVVYISFGKSGATEKIVKSTIDKPILIVTERDDQIKKGACISFIIEEDGSLRFMLNDNVLATRKLLISKALRSMAVEI